MKSIVVQKYGGSSVSTPEAIKTIAQRIIATAKSGKQVVVVVSAMGTATDDLLQKARTITDSPSRRELDMLLSCGERTSMALLSIAIQSFGYKSISLTGSQSGIITDDRHSGAKIIEVRPIRVREELEKGHIVIVAGFQGISYKKEITTLGRGGSDTTAVALAAALNAEYCEICSDVDGVYTADPRIVTAAKLLESISHDEMLELASFGAKVLHPACIEIAKKTGIVLYARATSKSGGGTEISLSKTSLANPSYGIAGFKNLVRLRSSATSSLQEVLEITRTSSIPILNLDANGSFTDIWFSLNDIPDWEEIRASLPEHVEVTESLGSVSVVGDAVSRSPQNLQNVINSAKDADVKVCAWNISPLRLTVFCEEHNVSNLCQRLHGIFIEQNNI